MMRTLGEVPRVRPPEGSGEPTGDVWRLPARLDARETERPVCGPVAAAGGAEGGDCKGKLSGGTVHDADAEAAVTTDSCLAGGEADGAELAFCIGGEGAGPVEAAIDVGASFGEGARDDAVEAVADFVACGTAASVVAAVDEAAGGLAAAGADATGLAFAVAPGVDAALSVLACTVGVDGADVKVEALSNECAPAGEASGEPMGATGAGEATEELRGVAPPWATENDTGKEG